MKILFSFLLIALPWLAQAEDPNMAERRKTITKTYEVSANDALSVDNKFGQVSVSVWNKPEIRVQINIVANAPTDARTQAFLDAVEITEKRTGNLISLQTVFNDQTDKVFAAKGLWNDGRSGSNYIRINYEISMPAQNALTIKNKFGNTDIATFSAPLTVNSRYGNFTAMSLKNSQTDLDIAFGNANIQDLEQAKLKVAYGNLELQRAKLLTLINKFGKMRIGDIDRLNADIDYAGAEVGKLREAANISLSFSSGLRIEQLSPSAQAVDIKAAYSPVSIPSRSDADFDVTVSYGDFQYNNAQQFRFSAKPDESNNRRGPQLTKQYIGKIGDGSGPKIIVISKFANVNFK